MFYCQAVLTVAMVAWVATRIDLKPLVAAFSRIRWPLIGLVFVIAVLDRLVTAWKWDLLMAAKGIGLGVARSFRVQMIANFLGTFLPSSFGFDAVRVYLAARVTGRAVDTAAASTVDRLIMVLGTLVLAAGGVIAGVVLHTRDEVHWSVPLVAVLALIGVAVSAKAAWMNRIGAMAAPLFGQRISSVVKRFYDSLHAYHRHRRAVAGAAVMTAIALMFRVLAVQAEAHAFAERAPFLTLLRCLPLAWVALMLPISIGNIGLQESAYLVVLGMVGIDPVSAVAISLLEQVISRIISLPGAVFWLLGRRADFHHFDSTHDIA